MRERRPNSRPAGRPDLAGDGHAPTRRPGETDHRASIPLGSHAGPDRRCHGDQPDACLPHPARRVGHAQAPDGVADKGSVRSGAVGSDSAEDDACPAGMVLPRAQEELNRPLASTPLPLRGSGWWIRVVDQGGGSGWWIRRVATRKRSSRTSPAVLGWVPTWTSPRPCACATRTSPGPTHSPAGPPQRTRPPSPRPRRVRVPDADRVRDVRRDDMYRRDAGRQSRAAPSPKRQRSPPSAGVFGHPFHGVLTCRSHSRSSRGVPLRDKERGSP